MVGPPPPSRRLLATLAVGALALAATACESAADEDARPSPTTTAAEATACPVGDDVPDAARSRTADPIPLAAPADPPAGAGLDIGTLLPRTGDLAFLGSPPVAAVELAVRELNEAGGVLGAPVTVRHRDSAEGTAGAVEAAADQLLAAGTDVVVGPLSSGGTAAVLDRVTAAGAAMVSPGAASAALDRLDGAGRLFRTVATEELQGRALARLVLADGIRTVDLVVRADAYGAAVATAFTEELSAGGGEVARRLDRAPAETAVDLGPLARGRHAEATVLAGLADVAPVVDALAADGRGPADHPTYGTDGTLGERLGDLVAERATLACLRGILAVAPPGDDLADALGAELAALGVAAPRSGQLVLDHAAEAYDAVVAVALAAEAAGAADGASVAGALPAVTSGGTACDGPAACLALVREGADVAYVGRSGPLPLDAQGNRSAAVLTLAAFDADGHLARLGPRPSS